MRFVAFNNYLQKKYNVFSVETINLGEKMHTHVQDSSTVAFSLHPKFTSVKSASNSFFHLFAGFPLFLVHPRLLYNSLFGIRLSATLSICPIHFLSPNRICQNLLLVELLQFFLRLLPPSVFHLLATKYLSQDLSFPH